MPIPSTHMGLLKPATTDPFVTGDIAQNWEVIDESPGLTIVTSTTRPTTWGANQSGRRIVETDTGLIWRWDGTQFLRQGGNGWLGGSTLGTNVTTTSTTTPAIGPSATVTVPAGGRRILVVTKSPYLGNASTTYPIVVGIQRDGASIHEQDITGNSDTKTGRGYGNPINLVLVDNPTAGAHTYRTYIMSYGGYSDTLYSPSTIDVFEI